ncbi:acyl-CoA thioesterase [Halalkalibacter alkalisediminis]|uniref:Acyl-CoA thioesterase n=1 Tax=Halalkalibacter alkalisediminis TaxID=935616 RepID=A0ABV6NCJ4_9BACI|nr:thioesterase family protein [Halalkalibacter alkalisediminis]
MRVPSYIESVEEWLAEFQFSVPVKVRFSETDAFGHLNNTKAFVYFEEARIEFFKHLGLMQKWTSREHETMVVVADLHGDFIQQIKFDERLTISVKVHQIGRSSIDLHYVAHNEKSEVCLLGRGTIVQISKETGRSVEWDEDMRMGFEK